MAKSRKLSHSSNEDANLQNESASQRITVTVTGSSYAEMVEIAREKNISVSEVVRRSIRRDLFVQGLLKEKGGRLLIETPDGKESYIFFDE